jgi:hypothetical protein
LPETDDYHYRSIAEELAGGRMIPFLGAGANLADRGSQTWERQSPFLPNGSELAGHLVERGNYPRRGDHDLLRVSQYVEAEVKEARLYRFLREVFVEPEHPPTSLHRLLARVARYLADEGRPQLVLATTNYDDLIERALDEQELPCDVVWYDARQKSASRGRFLHRAPGKEPVAVMQANDYKGLPLALERPAVLKLHGCFNPASAPDDAREDSYVITEDSYIDYLSGIDVGDLVPIALWQQMTQRSFLFLGYSLSDWNMRVILNRIWRAQKLEEKSWAIQREPRLRDGTVDQEASKIERKLWDTRDNIELVYRELDEYVRDLESRLPFGVPAGRGG